MFVDAEGERLKFHTADVHGFHHADVRICFVFFHQHNGFRLVVQFGAYMSAGVVVALVLVEDGVQVNLMLVRPLHEFRNDTSGFGWRIDVIDKVTHTVDDDQPKIVSMPDGSIYDSQPFFWRILAKGKKLQPGLIVAFWQSGQTQDALHYPLAVVGALLRIHVEDVSFVLREMGGIAQYGMVGQCRCDQSRQVESLFTLGFAYGRAEVAQRADARIADYQHLLLPFVFFFHTENGLTG